MSDIAQRAVSYVAALGTVYVLRLSQHATDVTIARIEGRHDDAARLMVNNLALAAVCRTLGFLPRWRT
jgi:hypothetical protein